MDKLSIQINKRKTLCQLKKILNQIIKKYILLNFYGSHKISVWKKEEEERNENQNDKIKAKYDKEFK